MQLYQSFWWLIQSFPNILDISSSVFKFRWKKPIFSMKPLWFSLSGIELVNKNTTEKYLYSAHSYCCFTYSSIFKLFHIFSSFFRFRWKKPIASSKPSQFPGSNEHVNSNATVKYWYSAQLCCCFISLENYNFLQEKILHLPGIHPISNFFLIFTPVSCTSSGRNLFLPGSHHSFWFHLPGEQQQ